MKKLVALVSMAMVVAVLVAGLAGAFGSRGTPTVYASRLAGISGSGITGIQIQSFRSRELVATVTDKLPGGRIIDPALGVGFYSNGWGYLPWGWSSSELDRFDLWRIR